MRNRYKTHKFYPEVLEVLGRNYNKLRSLCFRHSGYYDARGSDDIFQDTILYVAQDLNSVGKSEKQLIEHFLYRYRMIEYQTIKDSQELKKIQYADHIQTEKEKE